AATAVVTAHDANMAPAKIRAKGDRSSIILAVCLVPDPFQPIAEAIDG
ncbi:MAG: hypothetical protein RL490_798, partial [Pseudomonadota bacterium]